MPDPGDERIPDPRKEDIYAGDRRISRPDSALPDWHIPDAKYRPIPIAWFAAAFLMQLVVLWLIFMILSAQNGWITIILSGLATGALGMWTWDRGMKAAGRGWQAATIIVMAGQLAFICLAASARL